MNYEKASELRSWAFGVEQYSRYARLYAKSSGWVKDRCKNDCERIKSYWPKQAKCFDQIDKEIGG